MPSFLRLPVGQGPIRIKYTAAEWSPQRNKLILLPPIEWYVENDMTQKGSTTDEIVMLDAAAITKPLTNPISIGLEWTGERGQPPSTFMHAPPPNAEPVEPTQAKSGGGKGGSGKPRLTRAQWEAAVRASMSLANDVAGTDWAQAFTPILNCSMFVNPADWEATQKPEPAADDVDESDVPF